MTNSTFQLPQLSHWKKKILLGYAEQVLSAQHQMLTEEGNNILHYTLKENKRHQSMIHYPKGDRIDHSTGSQYFYHCHRENFDSTEHGHFHCFLRYKHIPKSIKPAPLPDWDKYLSNPMTHLVAIAMNTLGQPIRLFTVNRWVTEEIWYEAQHLPKLIKRYKMTLNDDPHWQILDKWIEGMLHLFAPQIAWIQQARDLKMQEYVGVHGHENPYIDEHIEDISDIPINLQQQVEWVLS